MSWLSKATDNWTNAGTFLGAGAGWEGAASGRLSGLMFDNTGNIMDGMMGSSSGTQTTTKNVPERDADAQTIWSKYMELLGNSEQQYTDRSTYLNDAYNTYKDAVDGYNTQYQGILQNLLNGLGNESNKISFSLGTNGQPVTFTSKQDIAEANARANLASQLLSNQTTTPTMDYANAKENNPYSVYADLLSLYGNAANANENRRYGVAGETTTAEDTSDVGWLDMLTGIGNMGSSFNWFGGSGSGGSGGGAAMSGIMSLFA